MPPFTQQTMTATAKSSPALTLFAWLVIGLPLAWGVWQTVIKSMALFR